MRQNSMPAISYELTRLTQTITCGGKDYQLVPAEKLNKMVDIVQGRTHELEKECERLQKAR